ncbi:hypothetical protein GCM10009544_45610 [Streptomyces stramineus]|uniref:Uncharacterized protein n=1 Tax=Streptomyces stramineus TaxID=173861 RepID=A0ABN1AKS9_9ACTN
MITWPTPPGGVRDAKGGGAGTSRAGPAGGLVDDTLIEVTVPAPGRLPGGPAGAGTVPYALTVGPVARFLMPAGSPTKGRGPANGRTPPAADGPTGVQATRAPEGGASRDGSGR